MTPMRPTGDWDGTCLAHEAFLFETDEELGDRLVPFALEGLSRDEPVLVVAGERVRTLLATELGQDVRRLAAFASAETWWRGGHATLQAYDRTLRALRATVPTWRLVAEPVWLAAEGREWSRFEAVANRCYATMPYYSLCLHDRQRLPASVLEAVARTHPLTWGGDAPVEAATYEDPQTFLRSVQPAWSARPMHPIAMMTVTAPREARRALVAAVTDGWRARVEEVVLATHELLTNALRAAASVEMAFWTDHDTLVVEVSDDGPGLRDETCAYVPPSDDLDEGRGMWLAWSLADDAAVASRSAGTAIRLYFRR
jgi:anti-sigma regulatory factor (Ser/Thr protein kinase)